MRRFVLTLVLFVVFFNFSNAQFSTTFNDTLKPFNTGSCDLLSVVEDGNYYYVLGVHYSSAGRNAFIMKTDDMGTVLLKKEYSRSQCEFYPYTENSLTKNDSILVFCSQMDDKSGLYTKSSAVLYAVDKQSLDTVWTKVYEHPDTAIAQTSNFVYSSLTSVKTTPDGGYILTGSYNKDCVAGVLRSFLMKTDGYGNVEWRQVDGQNCTFSDVEIAADSGYYVPGIDKYGNMIKLMKYGKSGSYLSKTDIATLGGGRFPVIAPYGNDYAIVSYGYLFDTVNLKSALAVMKINLNTGTILWSKKYYAFGTSDSILPIGTIGLETSAAGDIIVSNTTLDYHNILGTNSHIYNAVVLKLNSNGDSLWCKSYDYDPTPNNSVLNDLILSADGGFLGVGTFDDPNSTGTAWLFKADANGVVGFESEKTKTKSGKYKVYPNPASIRADLLFDSSLKEDAVLKIYNVAGELVMQKQLKKGLMKISMNLQDFMPGLFFYTVSSQGKDIATGKLIVE
jgi:hypothetical protein